VADLFDTSAYATQQLPLVTAPTPTTPPVPGAYAGVRPTAGLTNERIPTVIVDDVHLTYRIHGAAKPGMARARPTPLSALTRIVTRQKAPTVREVHAVRGVSFTAYRGEAIGLIGSNGSGKSTILRAIAGLLPTDKGAIYTSGQPSLLGANAALFNDLTGEQNIVLGLLAMGMTREEAHSRIEEIVEFSGINEGKDQDFSTLPMETYSSGMAARLRFSIAAAKMHDVLLVDEALATGDARFRMRSENRVRELLQGAGTVFLVSHAIATILEVCTRSIWLERGELRMDGPTEEVVAAYEAYTKR
jgi:teichoic acid transport system ATP-binding protein